jgi:hypothetical protein
MYAAQPPVKLFSLDTDHSSYFSATDDLVKILLEIRDSIG